MPHNYNRNAFNSLSASPHRLLAVYATLVEIELALKDHLQQENGNWPKGHRILDWLTQLGEAASAVSLRDELAKLCCTDLNGQQAQVDLNKYPDLRYLRHVQDYPGGSNEAELGAAFERAKQTRALLTRRGIAR